MDETWMRAALQMADEARKQDEVPVGAVLIMNDEIIGRGFNHPVGQHDPSAHAEIEALRDAAQRVGNYRLPGSSLFVTVEPCTMCAGALIHARVERLVFATREPKAGAVISTAAILENPRLNHRVIWSEGVMATESAALLSGFFAERRKWAKES